MENSFDVEKDVVPFVTFLSGYDGSPYKFFGEKCSVLSVGIKLVSGDAEDLKHAIITLAYDEMGEDLFFGEEEYSRLRLSQLDKNEFVLTLDDRDYPGAVVIGLISMMNQLLTSNQYGFEVDVNLFRYMEVPNFFLGIKSTTEKIKDRTDIRNELIDVVELANMMIGVVFYNKAIHVRYVNSIALSFEELTDEEFKKTKIAILDSIEEIIHKLFPDSYCSRTDIEDAFKVYRSGNEICIVYKMELDEEDAVIVTMLMDLIGQGYKFTIKRIVNFDADVIEWIKKESY